jgi:hypothetical protein
VFYLNTPYISGVPLTQQLLVKRNLELPGNIRVVRVRVPEAHGYLYVKGGDCGIDFASDFVATGFRRFSAQLERGYQGRLDFHDLSLVGTLPLIGADSVVLLPQDGTKPRVAALDHDAFYFAGLRPERYTIRVTLSSGSYVSIPIDLSHRRGQVRSDVRLAVFSASNP